VKRALLLVLVLAGCGSSAREVTAPSSEEPRPVVVRGCEPLYHEPAGEPRLVIVSDLPLEAPVRTAMHQMTQAIKLTLKDRAFRAGKWSVGYVVCDDSGAQGHFSAARCAANARRASSVARVIGMIGTLDSACARAELPILARAGIVMVGPLNTADDLTRVAGRYARLSASDAAQAAAAAQFIRAGGAKTVAVVSDGTTAGDVYAHAFAARHDGLRVVRGPADAAYLAGALSARTPALLHAARARARGPVVLAETLGPAAQLASIAGTDAAGAYLVVAGVGSSRGFAAHFERELGAPPHPYAGYAAQAATILLDAIASSDGSRASVRTRVFAGRAAGPLGTITFDAHGEPRPAPATIFRVVHGEARFVRVVDSGLP
jgi:ABC-type branched-subunit amino acid transport system substrate-binding protein